MERNYVVVCNEHKGIGGALLFWGSKTEDNAEKKVLVDIQVISMLVKNTLSKK